jgi:two-component system alkaline phosphatase synthesis response regulator PhoP
VTSTPPQQHGTASVHRRVLIADPDPSLRREVRERLRTDPLDLYEVDDTETACEWVESCDPDLVLLGLHGYGALDALRHFRRTSSVPLLALVADAVDGVDAIEAGADDYVRVPCSVREIVARARSALRRQSWSGRERGTLEFGRLRIDRDAREVCVDGTPVPMPLREFELLAHLAGAPRRVHSRVELLHVVWNASTDWLGPATVTEHVHRLRCRLSRASRGPTWIRTVRNAGYRFDPDG